MFSAKNITLSIALIIVFIFSLHSQEKEGFKITEQIETTSVKNQDKTGTCWSFATISFLESEAIRLGNDKPDLSEMYIVKEIYRQKAKDYIRFHGNITFSQGGQAHDVMNAIRVVGLAPEKAYSGLQNEATTHNHTELVAVLKSVLKTLSQNPQDDSLTSHWPDAVQGIIDAYLGKSPDKFKFGRKEIRPEKYMKDEIGINPADYIEFTSYTHHPFYEPFVLEIPDNWSFDQYYNVTVDDLAETADYSLKNGYSVCWDGDVSEPTFDFFSATAKLDDNYKKELKSAEDYQTERQRTFNNRLTTDDHLMHITGKAEDSDGNPYYLVKNSWGESSNSCGGYLYMSVPYYKIKTVAIMVHKDGIPNDIRKKLDL
jgi:bleomycin hydrolase